MSAANVTGIWLRRIGYNDSRLRLRGELRVIVQMDDGSLGIVVGAGQISLHWDGWLHELVYQRPPQRVWPRM
jgi:hypothetical protein